MTVLLVALGCGLNAPGAPEGEPRFGEAFSVDLDGDGQPEPVQVDYEQVRIGALVQAVPKIQIDKPPVIVLDIDRKEPLKELAIQAVDAQGIGVWHVLLYQEGEIALYTFEVSSPPEVLGDGVLRIRNTHCGETTVTDWARSGRQMTQTRTETIGMYNVALCSG